MHVKWKVEHFRKGRKIAEYDGRNSFVQGGIGMLSGMLNGYYLAGLSTKDTGNTARTPQPTSDRASGARRDHAGWTNSTTLSLLCGTDGTAVATTDYKLGTQIAHGTGAGQLSHGAISCGALMADGTDGYYFNLFRTFTNSSGGTITVSEIGVYNQMYDGAARTFCILRDTPTAVVLLNGDNATITYQFYGAKTEGVTKQFMAMFREYGTASGTTTGKDTSNVAKNLQLWCSLNGRVSLYHCIIYNFREDHSLKYEI